ncbi:Regulator of polyketide synthase expression [Planococcus halocryophilus Or1]|uniref:Regulator of polyketide synthase expression n=1 Tax=Planococcus halocryophilus TaxID=1215089 RepID=A0A1C7DUV8_9BACL|nr:helix-turn-helix domain-containing protein [Planococcus halocryophilus]ANU15192.1 regulator of polyketide synthase expression [Planococcus halocryophilus]EMF47008.1 Regulator of polyketide synthase expression [Planococcus halocryophilus Or1]
MINQLKELYPSLQLFDQSTLSSDADYKWFSFSDGVIIGIHERELAPRDLSLLTTFLTPYNPKFPVLTDEEKKWSAAVDPALSADVKTFPLNSPYRFVHFSIQEKQISPAAFKQAVQDFYAQHVPILWENDHQGILVEYVTKEDGPISYDEIIDVLMSDLYIKIHFFVGPLRASLDSAVTHYRAMVDGAKTVSLYSKKTVISYTDAIPYLLLDQTPEPLRNEIKQSVLQVYQSDEETMKMIEVFVRNNLNISETAKALHMHRNSLQYRFDRFYENTGIDVRKFHEALAVYLAILIEK